MREWLLCFLQIIAYSVGVMTACGLAVELCHRLCFWLLGRRGSRILWYATVLLGAPVHELGHAVMCLLFCHRIEKIRLLPTKSQNACVVHTYNQRNVYAAFGNLCIGIGPLLSGLGVIFLVLYLVFPSAWAVYGDALVLLRSEGVSARLGEQLGRFLLGLVTEQARPLWARLLGGYLLFSMALHVRLSTADVYEMRSGIPGVLLLSAIGATAAVVFDAPIRTAMAGTLKEFALLVVALFSIIFLIAFALVIFAALVRLACTVLGLRIGGK